MKINLNNTVLSLTAGRSDQLKFDKTPQIAFSGRSNVGKSSLINKLLNRKSLARVSAEPGKTIPANYYTVDNKLHFVDLPGYGYAKRSDAEQKRWSTLVETYFAKIAEDIAESGEKRLVFQLIDSRHGPTTDDNMMLGWLGHYGIPYCIVATKCDKLNKTEFKQNIDALHTHPLISEDAEIIPFSALKGTGRERLWEIIESFLLSENENGD